MINKGKIVEYVVRKRGINLSTLASDLNVNRRTVYNWFQCMSLKRDIIFRIGVVIHHDFSDDFPELFTKDDFLVTNTRTYGKTTPTSNDSDIPWKDKYIDLLERYKDLIISSMNSHSIINQ